MVVAIFLNSGIRTDRIIRADKVLCADGGLAVCPVKPDVLLGDGDSLTCAIPEGVTVIRHNPHKNDTDGTLAVRYAVDVLHATEIDLYGVLGGRYDHTLGNFTLLSLAHSLGVKCTARESGLDIIYATGKFELDTEIGDLISVIPYGGDAFVKNYSGLEYPLINLRLTPIDTRGISNVATSKKITLDVVEGDALVFHYFK